MDSHCFLNQDCHPLTSQWHSAMGQEAVKVCLRINLYLVLIDWSVTHWKLAHRTHLIRKPQLVLGFLGGEVSTWGEWPGAACNQATSQELWLLLVMTGYISGPICQLCTQTPEVEQTLAMACYCSMIVLCTDCSVVMGERGGSFLTL